MKQMVTVLGGRGYFGNVLVDTLLSMTEMRNKYDVGLSVVDCGLFCGYDKKQDILFGTFDRGELFFDEKHILIWSIDIDVPVFYSLEQSAGYIAKNLEVFESCAKKAGKRMLFVTDAYRGEQETYMEFLKSKKEIAVAAGCRTVTLPSLYGPCKKMRFDTYLNDLFRMAYMQGGIYVDEWMKKRILCSVADAAKTVAENIFGETSMSPANHVLSSVECAFLMNEVFEGKIRVATSNDSGYDRNFEIPHCTDPGRNEIVPSFSRMRKHLEMKEEDLTSGEVDNVLSIRSYSSGASFALFMNRAQGDLKD